jgi:putative two-component system response regulator
MPGVDIAPSRILIIDDEERVVDLLREILEAGGYHNLLSTTDPRQTGTIFHACNPDLIILDLHLPQLSGLDVLRELTAASAGTYLPVVVLTGDATPESKRRVLGMGAKDFLIKPFDTTEVLLRIKNLLTSRVLYKELKHHNETLEQRVQARTRQLAEAQVEILNHLAIVSEYQDDDTSQHTQRVGALAATLARSLGQTEEQVELIRLAAPLHDIGKVGVPNHILVRTGKLMPSEFEIMQSHTTVGGEIFAKSKFPLLQLARQIALYHHERWDGLGYPQRLKGEDIPLPARIVAVVDAFDALTHVRSYRKAVSFQEAASEIRAQAGAQFDPQLVKVFLGAITPQLFQEIIASAETINPEASLEALAVVCEVSPDTRVKQEAVAASQSGRPMAEMPG